MPAFSSNISLMNILSSQSAGNIRHEKHDKQVLFIRYAGQVIQFWTALP
jgi:hypothetical protein